jgi:hypothetical protein
LGNVTLTNVTISSGNVTLTGANVSGTANVSTLVVTGNQTSLGNVAITGNISANIVTVAAGAVGTPSITTTGDTNTGIFFPAADTIAFAEGGAEAARFDSSGNFCLGTAAVLTSGKLSLQADLSAVNAMTLRDSGTTYGVSSYYTLYQNSAGSTVGGIGHTAITSLGINATTDLQFFTAATERARINSSGNVGIGTSSPSDKLTVISAGTQVGSTNFRNIARIGLATNDASVLLGYDVSAGSAILASTNNYPIAFWTSIAGTYAEKMRIDSSGNVGIGTTATAGQQLTIASSGSSSAANAFYVYNSTPVALFTIRNDGAIFSGTAPASPYNLTTASAANMFVDSSGVVYRSTSSLRYKENVQDYGKGLSDIAKLRPVTFNTKPKDTDENSDTHTYAGFIAEEVDAAGLTEFVQYNNEGQPDALAYPNMVALLTKAIQEQQALITALTARITALESN